jgi:hypothetical protein
LRIGADECASAFHESWMAARRVFHEAKKMLLDSFLVGRKTDPQRRV